MTRTEIRVCADSLTWVSDASRLLIAAGQEAIAARGRYTLMVAGGSTPGPVYAAMAESPALDWSRVEIFWGDERCVPPEDARSNYRMLRERLLDRVPIPAALIHRIHGESEPLAAAARYADLFTEEARASAPLDVVVLGMGADGHTASLFPGSQAARETQRTVAAEYVPAVSMWRISCTPVLLNTARLVLFLVTGEEKAATLQQVLEGPPQPELYPAQAIRPAAGRLVWMLDRAAAHMVAPHRIGGSAHP